MLTIHPGKLHRADGKPARNMRIRAHAKAWGRPTPPTTIGDAEGASAYAYAYAIDAGLEALAARLASDCADLFKAGFKAGYAGHDLGTRPKGTWPPAALAYAEGWARGGEAYAEADAG